MSKGNYNLKWETLPDHLVSTVALLRSTSQFTDVTLLCEDMQEIKAHKFILNACSSVFRNIFEHTNNPCIYLKGVKYAMMDALLDFMYNGKTVVKEENLSELLSVAKELGMTELNEDEKLEEEDDPYDIKIQETANENNTCDIKMQEIANLDSTHDKLDTNHENKSKEYFDINKECPLCFKIFTESYALKNHIKTIHEGISHACDECSKVFTDKANLSRHKNARHKGIKYPCHSCSFMGSYRGSLMTHIKTKHENQ